MSALIVSHDLHIMMLELAVEKLYVPRTSVFDSVIMKKTTVMFRLLDDEWTALSPHRSDYRRYRGSNYESELFHGGKSIVFSIPEASLQKRMKDVDLQMHISKDVSRYFEMHPSQNVGFVIIKLDKLFNGIIKELKERKELAPYLNIHEREPIARSMKGIFSILNENSEETGSEIDLYVRVSYFGKSIITEIVIPGTITKAFYAREETNEKYPYQCRELKSEELEGGCWGSVTFVPPVKPQNLQCDCQSEMTKELLERNANAGNKNEEVQTKEEQIQKEGKDKNKEKDKGKKKEKGKGKNKSKVSDEDKDDKTGMSDISVDKNEKKEDEGEGEGGKMRKDKVEKKDVGTEMDVEEKKKKKKKKKKEDKEKEKEVEEVTDKSLRDKDIPKEVQKLIKDEDGDKDKGKKKVKESKEKVKEDKRKGKEKVKGSEEKVKEDKGKGKDEVKKKEEAVEKENDRGNEKNEGKRKKENIVIDAERIRKLRRRNAGPCTIGIAEKKIRPCMPFIPPCPCTVCSPHPIYTPPCPMPPCFSPVYYPQMQFSQDISTLQCS